MDGVAGASGGVAQEAAGTEEYSDLPTAVPPIAHNDTQLLAPLLEMGFSEDQVRVFSARPLSRCPGA